MLTVSRRVFIGRSPILLMSSLGVALARCGTPGNLAVLATPAMSASGPLRVSADNPRYFADPSGRVVYLTGSHTWDNFQDWGSPAAPFDYDAYLQLLRRHGHNFTRLWVWEQPGISSRPLDSPASVEPLPYLRPGPGLANDGKPRFDLTRFNPGFFERLRRRLIAAAELGIYASIMLFQEYLHWPSHPFNVANNINGINGDANGDGNGREVHTSTSAAVTTLQCAYIRRVVDVVNDLENVLYEIGNEFDRPETFAWQLMLARYIKAYQAGLPKQHPVGITATGGATNADLFASPADWISPRVLAGEDYAYDPPEGQGAKVIISDTDHIWPIVKEPTAEWVWKSFLRGLNPITMDVVQNRLPGGEGEFNDPANPRLPAVRRAMGQTRAFASRLALSRVVPASDLASTRYCLAASGSQYLVYVPAPAGRRATLRHWFYRPSVTVDLSGASGSFVTEWFYPSSGTIARSDDTLGGAVRRFRWPLTGDAVLFLYR
jgi:hypothetical protein